MDEPQVVEKQKTTASIELVMVQMPALLIHCDACGATGPMPDTRAPDVYQRLASGTMSMKRDCLSCGAEMEFRVSLIHHPTAAQGGKVIGGVR